MKVLVSKSALLSNIEKAKALVPASAISVMLKSFYEYFEGLLPENIVVFSKSVPGSICYSIGEAKEFHKGAVIVDIKDSETCHYQKGINIFYIPVNVGDNREGLTVENAIALAKKIKIDEETKCVAMITSGCINEAFIPLRQLTDLWNKKTQRCIFRYKFRRKFLLTEKNSKNS